MTKLNTLDDHLLDINKFMQKNDINRKFRDVSYGNDACPSISNGYIHIFIVCDHPTYRGDRFLHAHDQYRDIWGVNYEKEDDVHKYAASLDNLYGYCDDNMWHVNSNSWLDIKFEIRDRYSHNQQEILSNDLAQLKDELDRKKANDVVKLSHDELKRIVWSLQTVVDHHKQILDEEK